MQLPTLQEACSARDLPSKHTQGSARDRKGRDPKVPVPVRETCRARDHVLQGGLARTPKHLPLQMRPSILVTMDPPVVQAQLGYPNWLDE